MNSSINKEVSVPSVVDDQSDPSKLTTIMNAVREGIPAESVSEDCSATDATSDSRGSQNMQDVCTGLLGMSPPKEVTMIVNPVTGGAKGQKLARFDLIPARPLWALAEMYGRGAYRYAERNWERGYKWSLSYAALMRHLTLFWQGEEIDPVDGQHHLDSVMFHAMALREFVVTHPELDDRPIEPRTA